MFFKTSGARKIFRYRVDRRSTAKTGIMEPIEQVFLYVRRVGSQRSAEIAATTPSVRSCDLPEIVGWFSEDVSESVIRFDDFSLFFHPLPSGDFALGLIYPEQRRGFFSLFQPPKSFFVRILLIPPYTLFRTGNHPVVLFEELNRREKLPLLQRPPKRLHPLAPPPHAALSDQRLLNLLAGHPGPTAIATLFQSLFDSVCTLFSPTKGLSTLTVLKGLIFLLPLRYRTELTFSTGLFFSTYNPFRLVGAERDARRRGGETDRSGVPVVALDGFGPEDAIPTTLDAWPRLVGRLLQRRDFVFLEGRLEHEYRRAAALYDENLPSNVHWNELNSFAESWERCLDGDREPDTSTTDPPSDFEPDVSAVERLLPLLERAGNTWSRQQNMLQATLSAKKIGETVRTETEAVSASLKERIERFPHLEDSFLKLDSSLAHCLFGDDRSLPATRLVWKEIAEHIAPVERERLREEYLALVRSVYLRRPESEMNRDVRRSSRFLDLMLIFLEK